MMSCCQVSLIQYTKISLSAGNPETYRLLTPCNYVVHVNDKTLILPFFATKSLKTATLASLYEIAASKHNYQVCISETIRNFENFPLQLNDLYIRFPNSFIRVSQSFHQISEQCYKCCYHYEKLLLKLTGFCN